MSEYRPKPKSWKWNSKREVDPVDGEVEIRRLPLVDQDGRRVLTYAGCGSHDVEISDADAALIAAAPDLLDACRRTIAAADELMTEFISHKRAADWEVINDGLVTAQKAITKAEGKSQT